MGMGFAPTWLRQVSPPPPASQNHLTTGYIKSNTQKYEIYHIGLGENTNIMQ